MVPVDKARNQENNALDRPFFSRGFGFKKGCPLPQFPCSEIKLGTKGRNPLLCLTSQVNSTGH